MKALENDQYLRKTDGYLPSANIAFIDEIFKANSAILNSLLTLLNERLFDNGTSRFQVPLTCMVYAPALSALHCTLLPDCFGSRQQLLRCLGLVQLTCAAI